MTTEPTTDLRTPDQWQQITGMRIIDADGWHDRDWTDPIGITEWQRRMAASTVSGTLQRSALDHLGGEYQRVVAELDQARRDLDRVTHLHDALAGDRDRLLDDLDICRGARDRYQRATSRLRAELSTANTLQHSAQAMREEVAHRIDVIATMTRSMLDEETITVGELRHWLRTGSPSPATIRREQAAQSLSSVEWGVRMHYRDGSTDDGWIEDEANARKTVDDVQMEADDGHPEWAGAELIHRAVGPWLRAEPAQTAPDAPTPAGLDLSTVIADRIASANLDGPADTAMARATIAVDTVLDACRDSLVAAYGDGAVNWALDSIDRENVAKAVLDAIDVGNQDDPDTSLIDGIIKAERQRADERVAEAVAVESQKADDRLGAVQVELQKARVELERVRAERDERLTLDESARLAKLVDQARAEVAQLSARVDRPFAYLNPKQDGTR